MIAAAFELVRPIALWGLLLALPILLFHLYQRRRIRVVVPFVGLIRESLGPMRATARFKMLREVAALATRLLALAAFVLALSGLRPAEAVVPAVDLVVVVDADVTTGAVEADGRPRFLHALELAAAWVRHHADGRVGVVLAADPPVVLAEPDDDIEPALGAIDALSSRFTGERVRPIRVGTMPSPATTSLAAAVRIASDAATRRGAGRVVVVTARPFEFPDSPDQLSVDVVGVGSVREDQRIIGFAVGWSDDKARARVDVRLKNDAARDVTRRLVADVGNDRVIDQDVLCPLGEDVARTFEVDVPKGGAWLRVALAGADAFAANDAVTCWLAPPTRPSVLLVHGDHVRLATLLVLEGLGEQIDWQASGRVHASALTQAEPRDVTIVDGVELPAGTLSPGAWVFLAPLAGDLPFRTGPVIEEPLVWRTESGHPLVRWLDFSAAHVRRGVPLSGAGLVPLAYADGKPVIAEGEKDGVRYVALGLDPDASLLPVQAGLPLFLRRAILRLVEAPSRPLRPFYRAGDVLRPRTPLPGGPEATVRFEPLSGTGASGQLRARVEPTGAGFRVPPGAHGPASVTTGDPAAPTWEGRTGFVDLDPDRTIVPARPPAAPPPTATFRRQRTETWWRALVLVALALLLLDLLLLSRSRRNGAR